jgi:hypothetical protein
MTSVTKMSSTYVRFYKDFVPCDFCGQPSRGRVYDLTQRVVCGSCGEEWFSIDMVTVDGEVSEGA